MWLKCHSIYYTALSWNEVQYVQPWIHCILPICKEMSDTDLLTFAMSIAESCCPHVTQANGALAAAVDEHVALVRVALSSCDHLCQLLHVGRLYIYNIWRRATVKENNYPEKKQNRIYWRLWLFHQLFPIDVSLREFGCKITFAFENHLASNMIKDTKTSICDF